MMKLIILVGHRQSMDHLQAETSTVLGIATASKHVNEGILPPKKLPAVTARGRSESAEAPIAMVSI